MTANILVFRFYLCPGFRDRNDVVRLAEIAAAQGLVLTNKYVQSPDGPSRPVPYKGDIASLAEEAHKDREFRQAPRLVDCLGPWFWFAAIYRLRDNAAGSDEPRSLVLNISGKMYGTRYNRVEVSSVFRPENLPRVEEGAQLLLRLAKSFYDHLHPTYGWLDFEDSGVLELENIYPNKKLSAIAWVNFFGPSYTQKFGLDFLVNAPGWKTEPLSDDGIALQVTESFIDPVRPELRNELISYFAPAGVNVVLGSHPDG